MIAIFSGTEYRVSILFADPFSVHDQLVGKVCCLIEQIEIIVFVLVHIRCGWIVNKRERVARKGRDVWGNCYYGG